MANHRVEVTGHRGAAAVEPENTLRGFTYALSLGVDRVETDVRLTRDGVLVIMHDARIDRTTNGSGEVAELTLNQIRQFVTCCGGQAPTLNEVLRLFRDAWADGCKTKLQIELKGPATAAPTVEAVRRWNAEDQVIFTSFDAERLAEAKRLLPQATCGFLSSTLNPDPIEIALRTSADAVHLYHDHISHTWVEKVHAAGLEARVWNIDHADQMRQAIATGVDGIGSNDPELLLQVLSTFGATRA